MCLHAGRERANHWQELDKRQRLATRASRRKSGFVPRFANPPAYKIRTERMASEKYMVALSSRLRSASRLPLRATRGLLRRLVAFALARHRLRMWALSILQNCPGLKGWLKGIALPVPQVSNISDVSALPPAARKVYNQLQAEFDRTKREKVGL